MFLNKLKNLYESSPSILKFSYSQIPFRYRAGSNYRYYSKFLITSQWFEHDKMFDYQLNCLRICLNSAYKRTIYYNKLFDSIKLNPDLPFFVKDFERIPFLEKKTVYDRYNDFIDISLKYKSYEGFTGGTTGDPLKVTFDLASHYKEWAFIHSLWGRVGYKPCDKKVAILGSLFKNNKEIKYRYNPIHNEMQFSPKFLEENDLEVYINIIKKYKPLYLYGLPSAMIVLANYIEKMKLNINGIVGVLCGSEGMTLNQRESLHRIFNAKVYTWYGQTEKVVLAGECEYSSDYHIFPEYGYTELIDAKGVVINEPGRVGEIVGTGFINHAMPLIRYRTGDYAEYAGDTCPCGRHYRRFKDLIGRRKIEYLYGIKGNKILFSSIETQKGLFDKVLQCQFIQDKVGEVELNVVSSGLEKEEIERIESNLSAQTFNTIKFNVNVVYNLKRTNIGKVVPIIQNCLNN